MFIDLKGLFFLVLTSGFIVTIIYGVKVCIRIIRIMDSINALLQSNKSNIDKIIEELPRLIHTSSEALSVVPEGKSMLEDMFSNEGGKLLQLIASMIKRIFSEKK